MNRLCIDLSQLFAKELFKPPLINALPHAEPQKHKLLHLFRQRQDLFLFPFKVACQIIPEHRCIFKPDIFHHGRGSKPKAQIVFPFPVFAVMSALKALPGIIGDLILFIPSPLKILCAQMIHVSFCILIRKLLYMPAKRSSLLHDQAVGRNMGRLTGKIRNHP